MSDWLLVKRFLAYKWLQNSLVVVVMSVSIALAVCVLLVAEGLHGGLVQAAKPFPLLLSAKGSPNQLVLNTVFLQDEPLGNIGYEQVERLRVDKNVGLAVPLGFGDNYRGYRVVGTEQGIFSLQPMGSSEPWLQLAAGRSFAGPYEAVVGAEVAKRCGLKIGDSFGTAHGLVNSLNDKQHQDKFTVVGILRSLHTPYDKSILVDLNSIWISHRHLAEQQHRDVSAVIIQPKGYAQAMQLAAGYSKDKEVQLVFPSKIVIRLFAAMGDVEQVLQLFSWSVLALALLLVGCSLYWFMLSSLRQQGIMCALGASPREIALLNFKLGMTLVVGGLCGGVLLGHGSYYLLGRLLQDKVAVTLEVGVLPQELYLLVGILLCGALCSWLPSKLCTKKDIVELL